MWAYLPYHLALFETKLRLRGRAGGETFSYLRSPNAKFKTNKHACMYSEGMVICGIKLVMLRKAFANFTGMVFQISNTIGVAYELHQK